MLRSKLMKHASYASLLLLIFVGIFLRIYNLNWGSPYYFHPDERNIASSISQLEFPTQMNPHFFAYGSLPIYSAFFLALATMPCNAQAECSVSFESAILILRVLSVILSLLIIPLVYVIGNHFKKGAGLLAATLTTFSTGLIQFSHFGTVEIWLTFFSLALLYVQLRYYTEQKMIWVVLTGIVISILVATKISSTTLVLLPLFVMAITYRSNFFRRFSTFFLHSLIILSITLTGFLLTNPFSLLDYSSFYNSLQYESSVAIGTLPVFYTEGFTGTIPIFYQLTSVLPFLINPVLLILFLAACIGLCIKAKETKVIILLIFFFILFIPQSILFVKWTRYLIPTLPLIYLILSLWILSLKNYKKIIICISIVSTVVFGVSYFITAFIEKDSRLQALEFAKKNIPSSSSILSETYDLGIVPFNTYYPSITLFNPYDLDSQNIQITSEEVLSNYDYLILPSQRVLQTRSTNQRDFPRGFKLYNDVLSGKVGFSKIYQSPCSIFCTITYLGNPIYMFEQTASVFDRPTIVIFSNR